MKAIGSILVCLFACWASLQALAQERAPASSVQAKPGELGTVDALHEKLRRIVIDDLEFDGTPLSAALRTLQEKSVEFDTEGGPEGAKGVEIQNRSEPSPDQAEPRITLKLKNVPLDQAIYYISELAGLKYHVTGRGVDLLSAEQMKVALFTRVFRVPASFGAAAQAGGQRLKAKDVLEKAGIVFPEGTSALYNSSAGKLIVRNTQSNLDLVEAYVKSL